MPRALPFLPLLASLAFAERVMFEAEDGGALVADSHSAATPDAATVICSVAVDYAVRAPHRVRGVVVPAPGARHLDVPTPDHLEVTFRPAEGPSVSLPAGDARFRAVLGK